MYLKDFIIFIHGMNYIIPDHISQVPGAFFLLIDGFLATGLPARRTSSRAAAKK
jgi:hypothetical protein